VIYGDFALVALLGLLGLRIFEACGADIADLGEEHGHRVLRVRGKGGKVVLIPLPPAVAWYAIRGYISTMTKHGADVMAAIRNAILGRPWTPPAWTPG
jgi:integrase